MRILSNQAHDCMHAVLECLPNSSFVLDERGMILIANTASERVFGYSVDELKGQPLGLLVPDYQRHQQSQDVIAKHQNGSWFFSHLTLQPGHIDDHSFLIASIRDISKYKQLEQTFQRFFNMSLDLFCIADFNGYFILLNPSWTKILGFSLEELMAKPFIEFVHPDDRDATNAEAARLMNGAETVSFENRYQCKNGSYRWILWTTSSSIADQRLYAVAHDITERKLDEKQLLEQSHQLEATNKELESFSYSVSHDLRSPLRGIDGFSQALLEDYSEQLDPTAQTYINRIRRASQHMGQLIDDMLALSRVSRTDIQIQSVNLSEMAQQIADELHKQYPERRAIFNIEPELTVHGDARLLQIALQNLFDNAWKFTAQRTETWIEMGKTEEGTYFVRDNGVGFNMAYSDKLFRPFQRLHTQEDFPGSGIGLVTIQRIIHRHGGKIWVDSKPEQGAVFYFSLPSKLIR